MVVVGAEGVGLVVHVVVAGSQGSLSTERAEWHKYPTHECTKVQNPRHYVCANPEKH